MTFSKQQQTHMFDPLCNNIFQDISCSPPSSINHPFPFHFQIKQKLQLDQTHSHWKKRNHHKNPTDLPNTHVFLQQPRMTPTTWS